MAHTGHMLVADVTGAIDYVRRSGRLPRLIVMTTAHADRILSELGYAKFPALRRLQDIPVQIVKQIPMPTVCDADAAMGYYDTALRYSGKVVRPETTR